MEARRGRPGWRTWVVAAATAVGFSTPVVADAPRRAIHPDGDPCARLLRATVAASPTVAALVDALDASDVIVVAELTWDSMEDVSDRRLQAVVGDVRYVRVRVSAKLKRWNQMSILAHELQHAREVAQAPDVRDEAALAGLMRRIGRETYPGRFETKAAVEVGLQALHEIARGRTPMP